ncbi:hypothetical protein E4G67_03225 [Candidatus Bathyarchaeota archaeon]|nr:MAG: hypothetical protein E4G67_03225 [Candidatus Bathyarchaeota archaeon]
MTQTDTLTEKDLLVDLTLHNMSAGMLKEFALKIVKPYFGGNMNSAIINLMKKAVEEETIVNQAIIMKNKFVSSGI